MTASGPGVRERGGLKTVFAAGGVLAALGAASCCVLPFALFMLGVSGAWMSHLTALAPYQPIFMSAAAVFLALGFWRVYRRPKAEAVCADEDWCARPASNRLAKTGLWSAAVLVGLAVAFPYVAPLLIRATS